MAVNHKTVSQQNQLWILAGRTGEYGPLNWPITARVLTKRYNKTSYKTYTTDNCNTEATVIAINLLNQVRIQLSHFTLQANNCKHTFHCFDILQYSYSHITLFSIPIQLLALFTILMQLLYSIDGTNTVTLHYLQY